MGSRARAYGAALLLGLTVAGPARAGEIATHRAAYDLVLERTSPISSVADVTGAMLFEWADACDGWAVTQRLFMTVYYDSGDLFQLNWHLVSWEAKDGLRYRFFVRKVENGETSSEIRGEARLDGVGGPGTADYELPTRKTVELPAGTVFPTAHSLALLERARAGEILHWAVVFDGVDEEGLSGISAIIGPPVEPASGEAAFPLLADRPAWPIALAFYDVASQAAEPEHEQSLRLHANGIAEDLVFNYGEFSVNATLQELEPLPAPPC